MRKLDIEAWALSVVDALRSHQPIEDKYVELKSDWPEPEKIARRLVGHANAAHGEPILWLVGVDEKREMVVGVERQEFSSWFRRVQAMFDEFAPEVQDVNVLVDDKTIVALVFETDRYPYVVKNPAFGQEKGEGVSREIPWREGTRTVSATHSHLVRMLAPLQRQPIIEVLSGRLRLFRGGSSEGTKAYYNPEWQLELSFYIIPRAEELVLPFHRARVEFHIPGRVERRQMERLRFAAPGQGYISATANEVIVQGPGRVGAAAGYYESRIPVEGGKPTWVGGQSANVKIDLTPAGWDDAVPITATLQEDEVSDSGLWGEWSFKQP